MKKYPDNILTKHPRAAGLKAAYAAAAIFYLSVGLAGAVKMDPGTPGDFGWVWRIFAYFWHSVYYILLS